MKQAKHIDGFRTYRDAQRQALRISAVTGQHAAADWNAMIGAYVVEFDGGQLTNGNECWGAMTRLSRPHRGEAANGQHAQGMQGRLWRQMSEVSA